MNLNTHHSTVSSNPQNSSPLPQTSTPRTLRDSHDSNCISTTRVRKAHTPNTSISPHSFTNETPTSLGCYDTFQDHTSARELYLETDLKKIKIDTETPLESISPDTIGELNVGIRKFITSKQRSMCLLADSLSVSDYQEIDRSIPPLGRVFIGSDEDMYLKKDELASAHYIIVNYSTISQVDSLNDLLECNTSTNSPKILGLLSQKDFIDTALSFQSRWAIHWVLDRNSSYCSSQ